MLLHLHPKKPQVYGFIRDKLLPQSTDQNFEINLIGTNYEITNRAVETNLIYEKNHMFIFYFLLVQRIALTLFHHLIPLFPKLSEHLTLKIQDQEVLCEQQKWSQWNSH